MENESYINNLNRPLVMNNGLGDLNYSDNSNSILFSKCKSNAKIPSRKKGDAGLDLYVCNQPESDSNPYFLIRKGETANVPTGIRSVIPDDYYIQIEERSSSGSKGIKCSSGIIDASYRGEWFLTITNCTNKVLILYNSKTEDIDKTIERLIESLLIYRGINSPNDVMLWDTEKALFQGIIHKTYNDMIIKEINDSEIDKFESHRGSGVMGSSGK